MRAVIWAQSLRQNSRRIKAPIKRWLDDRCHQLKHTAGATEALYDERVALQARKCTLKLPQHLRDKLGAAITYYKNHRHQMDYTSYTEQHFPIGSGVTEAACKTLIKQRFCLAGMRWKQPGAAGILNLRALVLTAQSWTPFWRSFCCGCFKLRLHPMGKGLA